MNRRSYVVSFIALLFIQSWMLSGQSSLKDTFFAIPVKHAFKLAGTFAELRSNHFHAGIDIKSSNGHSGDPIFAAGDGYVSRIKIQAAGYGRSLYITHANGYTTVYAHLSAFEPALEKYVRDQQYKHKKFDFNLYPQRNQFIFHRGEEIGKMGNTGSSSGPHLHFEIRKTKSEIPMNPLDFIPHPKDTIPPVIQEIKLYGMDPDMHSIYTQNMSISSRKKRRNSDTLIIPAWRMGVAVRVYDKANHVANKNGVYSLEMRVDGKKVYRYNTHHCSFSETRYINAHVDYKEWVYDKKPFNRCFILPGNQLSMYDLIGSNGIFKLFQNKPSHVLIIASDANGNKSQYEFWVKRQHAFEVPASQPHQYHLGYNEDNYLSHRPLAIFIPKGSFYQNTYLNISPVDTLEDGNLAFSIGDKGTALHKYIQLSIRTIPAIGLKDKTVLTTYDSMKNRTYSYGGNFRDDDFQVRVRNLGKFRLAVDTIAPTITVLRFKEINNANDRIKFKIIDNFTPVGKAKSLRIKASIDGKWALMEYDLKSRSIAHPLDGRTAPGEHEFVLTVTDDRNNSTTFKKTFIVKKS